MAIQLAHGDRVRHLLDRSKWLCSGTLAPYWEFGVVSDYTPNDGSSVWIRPDGYTGDILSPRKSIAKVGAPNRRTRRR